MIWTISAVKRQTKADKTKTDKTDIDTDTCIHMRLVWLSPPLAPWSKWMKSNTDIESKKEIEIELIPDNWQTMSNRKLTKDE